MSAPASSQVDLDGREGYAPASSAALASSKDRLDYTVLGSRTMASVNIIFEDDFLLVADKASGVPTHPGDRHEDDNLLRDLQRQLTAGGVADVDTLAPMHRLDLPTSGLVAFGRSATVTRNFQKSHANGDVKRRYLALCQGITHRKGLIKVPLSRQGKPRRGQTPTQDARTRYRRLVFNRAVTLVRVRPETGRPHQIRRHLRSIGHPIACDDRWGDIGFNRWIVGQHGLNRLFLHAAELSFPHPITNAPMTFASPLPLELQTVLESLGLPPLPPTKEVG